MFCEKCGTQNPNGAKFCRSCGAPMAAPAGRPAQGGYAQQPSMGYAAPMTPVRELLRALGTGPLFLTGAIAYSVALLLQLIDAFVPGDGLGGTLYSLMQLVPSDVWYYAEDYGIDISESIGAAQAGSFISTLFSTLVVMLPGILTAVSIWLIFVEMRDTTGKPIGTTGFTILKVLTIIGIVGQVFMLIFAEIIIGIFSAFMSEYSYDGSETPILIAIMVIVAIGFSLAILYNVLLVRTLGSMADTARALAPVGKGAVYVAVMCFIGAVFMLAGLLFAGGPVGMLNVLCLIVAQVAFGILLLSYRGKMNALTGVR